MIGGIGMPELIIVLLIVLIIFGAGKLPGIGSGLGNAIRNFKHASIRSDEVEDISENLKIGEKKNEV